MKFIDVLWGSRRHEPNPTFQERAVKAGSYPPHGNVQSAPIRPPVKREGKRA